MLVLKSFFRKKTTKIYLLIYILIIFSLFLLLFVRGELQNLENKTYDGSYIIISSDDEENLNNRNVAKIYQVLRIEEGFTYLVSDERLEYNEIILPKEYEKHVRSEKSLELEINNHMYQFVVKSYDDDSTNRSRLIVSKSVFDENKDSMANVYLVVLKNWLKGEETVSKYREYYGTHNVMLHSFKQNMSYSTFIIIINVMLIALVILFLVVLLVTCFNIIQDETKKNLIYYRLGYKKRNLEIYNFVKIIILLVTSLFISSTFAFLLKIIFTLLVS